MKFFEALDIDLTRRELITFVGAGGKTTALFRLARELKGCNKSVLVTTTTAIYCPGEEDCDQVITVASLSRLPSLKATGPSIVAAGRGITRDNKLQGLDSASLTRLYRENRYDYILVEGDGSRQRPIKAPANHEPVIPEGTTKAVGVIGLDALGKKINGAYVHRPDVLCKLTDMLMGAMIDEEVLARLISAPTGLFKSVPAGCERYLLLNKIDDGDREQSARRVIALVEHDCRGVKGFVVGSMLTGTVRRVSP